jgi:thioredoxin 1
VVTFCFANTYIKPTFRILVLEETIMSTQPFHVTDSNFEQTIQSNRTVLVDFWANWCGPCRALGPIIEELAGEYSGKVLVGKLDVDESPQTAEKFQVFSIPTMIIFKDGQEAERLVGLCPKTRITDALAKHQ